ncbi:glycosyl transferase family, a/b domain-containing protein [Lipomyces oligophaga]|uniref:glycosyl transferase family, a/b domain-containing protein n=1 Tax=Lipomyces oligophaga TaxID=45792 RepID=UPI0034CFA1AD
MSTSLTPLLRILTDISAEFGPLDLQRSLEIIFTDDVSPVQVAGFLTALRVRKFDRDPEFIAAAVTTMKKFSVHLEIESDGYVDIVGTGGDGKDTFNVSTTAGMLCAGMGIKICKHGNRAATSSSGAADVLTSLGASVQAVTKDTVSGILQQSPFVFLFAPVFHPVMSKIAPVRKALGVPTIFNVLGPLLNPAPISSRIIGVNVPELGPIFAESIILLDKKSGENSSSMIVCGAEGLDEISIAGPTNIWRVRPGSETVEKGVIEPADFGLNPHPLEEVASGTPKENSEMVMKLVNNELPQNHPVLDYVLINAAALSVISGKASDWKQGVELARESLSSGAARTALELFVQVTSATQT